MDIGWQVLVYFIGFLSMLGISYGGYIYCKQLEQHNKENPEEKNNFLSFKNHQNENNQFLLI